VFRLLGQRSTETGNLAPTELVSACRPRSVWTRASEYATIAPVGRQQWISWDDQRKGIAFFPAFDCVHATDIEKHICFQNVRPYGCNFANGSDFTNLRVSPFYILVCACARAHTHTHTHPSQITVLNSSTNRRTKTHMIKKEPRQSKNKVKSSKLNRKCDADVGVGTAERTCASLILRSQITRSRSHAKSAVLEVFIYRGFLSGTKRPCWKRSTALTGSGGEKNYSRSSWRMRKKQIL
jgi:hypothetical protein